MLTVEPTAFVIRASLLDAMASIRPELEAVDEEIARRMQSPVRLISEVAKHTLGAGGKRLRPALTILSAKSVGAINPRVITFAGVVELTHTATLIHDDIIDHAELRRGRPAATALWGSHVSVLVGDYFFSQVFCAMSEDGLSTLMPTFSRATSALCQGEIEEIELRGNWEADEDEYLRVIQHKTAELMRAAAELGALAGGGAPTQAACLGDYGLNIGMAFQLVDDILDVTSDQAHLGKPAGHDLLEGSVTLPVIRALRMASAGDRSRMLQLLDSACVPHGAQNGNSANGNALEAVAEVVQFVQRYDGVAYSKERAEEYAARARAALATIPQNPASAILDAVCDFVIAREA